MNNIKTPILNNDDKLSLSIFPFGKNRSGEEIDTIFNKVDDIEEGAQKNTIATPNGLPDIALRAQYITPIDLTGQTVDFNTLVGDYRTRMAWGIRSPVGTTFVNAPIHPLACLIEYIPMHNSSGNLVNSGMQIVYAGNGNEISSRAFSRKFNSDIIPQWSQWVVNPAMSSSFSSITITGTLSEINARLLSFPKLVAHTINIRITDGDYSDTELRLSNIICNGTIDIRGETAVDAIDVVKPVKIRNIYFLQCSIRFANIVGIDFQGMTQDNIGFDSTSMRMQVRFCDFRANQTTRSTAHGINSSTGNRISLRALNNRFYACARGISVHSGSVSFAESNEFYNCLTGIHCATGGIATQWSAVNYFDITVDRNTYRDTGGVIATELPLMKSWSSGNYTGEFNEFIFARLNQSGVYRITIVSSGVNNVGARSWEIHSGGNTASIRKIDNVGASGQPSEVRLEWGRTGSTGIVLKAVCDNSNIGDNTNNIVATITPIHAAANDGFVTLNPTDAPTTWNPVTSLLDDLENKYNDLLVRVQELEGV